MNDHSQCVHAQVPRRISRSALGIVRAAAAKMAEIASPATKTGPFKRISIQPGVLETQAPLHALGNVLHRSGRASRQH